MEFTQYTLNLFVVGDSPAKIYTTHEALSLLDCRYGSYRSYLTMSQGLTNGMHVS